MEISKEDEIVIYDRIKGRIIEDGDQRWRKIDDCTETTGKVNERFSEEHTTIELIRADVRLFKKIGWLLVSTSIAQLVVSIFENILR